MRSTSCITFESVLRQASAFAIPFLVILSLTHIVAGQRFAVVVPNDDPQSDVIAEVLAGELSSKFDVQDRSMSKAAFRAVAPKLPFNMAVSESKTVGSAIACDYFILVRSETVRRSSFERPEYYESFAAIYTVASRTGKLEDWRNITAEGLKPDASQKALGRLVVQAAPDLVKKLQKLSLLDPSDHRPGQIEELPPENSPESKNFRAPIPFARIKPAYTNLAYLYDITATVEIEVDLDAAGKILRTSIVRWAGYGLDESVETAVRSMNWRPAERNGKPLPMRVLLRYNFKKIEK